MINLASNGGNRFDQLLFYIHYLWIEPLQIIKTDVVLYFYIGISSLVGLVIMLGLFVPLQSYYFCYIILLNNESDCVIWRF